MGEKENSKSEPKPKPRHNKKQIYASILKQMEFYFSDAALSKDRFLSQLMEKDPYIPIETFLSFNKIKSLTQKASDIAKALTNSNTLEISEDGTKIKRITPLIPYDVDARTIYVESIPASANIEWLFGIFQTHGPVAYISLPKYSSNRIKGFAFVEFVNPSDAEKCLKSFTDMGCKLPCSIKPDDLMSCQRPVRENSEVIKEEKGDKNEDDSTDEPPAKKIKITTEIQHKEVNSNTEKNIKKEEPIIKNNLLDKNTTEQPESVVPKDNLEPVEDAEKKSKHVRKRKKKDRKKHNKSLEKKCLEEAAKGLQILSKKEWKVLRNKYLEMQRKHMEVLKRALRTQHALPSSRAPPSSFVVSEPIVENSESVAETKPTEIPFVEGVIVAAKLSEPCLNVKQLKQATKANIHVKYVDVKEGSTDVYVRMDDNLAAKQFSKSGIFPEARILEGDEEKLYWDELQKQQHGRSSSKRKMRGRDRLVKKAQQFVASAPSVTQTGKHIRFEE